MARKINVETLNNATADTLYADNTKLVYHVAKRFKGQSQDDLIQAGQMGLWEAATRFDASKGSWGSFAYTWIRMRMMEVAMTARPVNLVRTREGRKVFGRLSRARQALIARNAECTDEALAAEIGVTVECVQTLVPMLDAHSVALEDTNEKGIAYIDTLAAESEYLDEHIDSVVRMRIFDSCVAELREGLSERDRVILDERVLADAPVAYDVLGTRYKVSKQRIEQIAKKLSANLSKRLTLAMPEDLRVAYRESAVGKSV